MYVSIHLSIYFKFPELYKQTESAISLNFSRSKTQNTRNPIPKSLYYES